MTDRIIIALSIDKVQSFLFETIHTHVQEKQTEAATLRSIMRSSHEISNGFISTVKNEFDGIRINELLSCSGVFIFECELSKDIIEEKLNALFLHFYCSSQGQKLLKFVSFPAVDCINAEVQEIQKAKKLLKQARCLNAIIEKNRDVLFSFHPVAPSEDAFMGNTERYPMFAENINALFSPEEADNENRFRIAVIKADLDGMGDMFKKITDYNSYCKISKKLNEYISLSGLHQAAKACRPDGRTAWLFPFYIAGDDIFFAVSVSNLIKGVDVCRQIVQEVNKQLCVVPSSRLSMSIGVEITFNRQPIRYYLDMVEKQLKYAKKSCPEALEEFLETKISIGGLTFFDINLDKKKDTKNKPANERPGRLSISKAETNKPIWQYFLHDIRLIGRIKTCDAHKEKVGTASFFHTLLEKITDEAIRDNNVKYMNNLLYHLLPEYLDSPDRTLRDLELLLKTAIIRQLYQKGEKGDAIVLSYATKHRLETYLRLMILFSDPRFNISQGMSQGSDPPIRKEDVKSVRKYLFTKPLDYLYCHSLKRNIRKLFVDRTNYSIYRNGWSIQIPCFQQLHIEKTMFIKLRDTKKVPIDKAAKMIALNNSKSKIDINTANEKRRKEGKALYHLYFDKDTFCEEAKKSGQWTSDYVDSLMLFYEYNEISIRFRGLYSRQKKGG